MPKHQKRRKESPGSFEPFAKTSRTDAGRRGLAAAPVGGDGLARAGSGAAAPPAIARQASFGSTSSARERRVTAGRGRDARKRQYVHGMAQINYQLYEWAKSELAKRESRAPEEDEEGLAHAGIAEHYLRLASDLRRRHDLAYGDTVVFGTGDCGQLGCGELVTEALRPRVLASLRGQKVVQVTSGGLHSLALAEDGGVFSWGCPDEGSLGWRATEEKDGGALPSEVRGFHPSEYGPNGRTEDIVDGSGGVVPFEQRKEAVITQIAAGETSSLALSTAGDVYMWGNYKDSEGRKLRHMPPKDDARVATGYKDMNMLEEDDKPIFYHPPKGNQDWPMHLVEIPKKAKDISAGETVNAALLEDDTLVTWGIGYHGDLARPVPELNKETPNGVLLEKFLKPQPPVWDQPTLKRTVAAISCGGFHLLVVAREQDGHCVYSSGLNNYGQLGHGDTENRHELTKIKFFEGTNVSKIEAGYTFSCFVDGSGKELYECGRGDYGQLGITLALPDTGYFESLPCRVPLVYEPRGEVSNKNGNCIVAEEIEEEDQPTIEQVSCGSTHVLLLTTKGEAYSWGFSTMGACGQGETEEDIYRPKRLVTKKHRMQYVSGGGQHSVAIVTTLASA